MKFDDDKQVFIDSSIYRMTGNVYKAGIDRETQLQRTK